MLSLAEVGLPFLLLRCSLMTRSIVDLSGDLSAASAELRSREASHSLGYRSTRLMAGAFNQAQMAMAEAYINGLEIPDSLYRGMVHASMPILFRHFPGLLAPYDWVLEESDRIAESSRELMEIQYDRPQEMLNRMLGDWEPIYPKYSTGFWEHGAKDLEESQRHMIDQMIERLGIVDGDNLLDFGCGVGLRSQLHPFKVSQPALHGSQPEPATVCIHAWEDEGSEQSTELGKIHPD